MDHRNDKFVPTVFIIPVAFLKSNFLCDRIFVICGSRLLGLLRIIRDRAFKPGIFVDFGAGQLLNSPIIGVKFLRCDSLLDAFPPLNVRGKHLSLRVACFLTPFLPGSPFAPSR